MERSNFACFKLFRGNNVLRVRFILIAIFIATAFNVSLLSVTSYAGTLAQTPVTQAPVVTQPPKLPVQSPTNIQDATKNCYIDRYGQMRCPNSGNTSTPAGPLGAACKTASGANGIWVVTSSASNMVCATTGDTCWTPSGGMGKVWGTGSTMICGGKGDYCPSSTGAGRVFVNGGNLACLGFGSYCTTSLAGSPCTGCKVVGRPGDYLSFECAKKYVNCPATAQASIQLVPTPNTGTVPVSMFGTSRYDSAAIYCDYYLKDVGKATSYSIPCNGAYANNTDARWRACTAPGTNTVEKQVQCDSPGRANGKVNAPVLYGTVNDMSVIKNAITANFKGSANDSARQNAICNYSIDGFIFQTKIPCNSLRKAASTNEYYCY